MSDLVKNEYELAKQCLWCPKGCHDWHIREEEGRYHLWTAYWNAINTPDIDNLLLARVLMMMNHWCHYYHDYDRLHKFIEPAKKAYDAAIAIGEEYPGKEYEHLKRIFEDLEYTVEFTAELGDSYEKSYKIIKGLEDVEDFSMYDSKVIEFRQDDKTVDIVLLYDGRTKVKIRASDIYNININTDPLISYIYSFYAYREPWCKDRITCRIGDYLFNCTNIEVVESSKVEEEK